MLETHARQSTQVLPGDRPRPLSLDGVHFVCSVQQERCPKPPRGVETGRGGCEPNEKTPEHRAQDDRDPGCDYRKKGKVPDEYEKRTGPKVRAEGTNFRGKQIFAHHP